MPISQERMIALTNAALDYQQALTTFNNRANALAKEVNSGRLAAAIALNELIVLSDPERLLATPSATISTIALESRHWHRTAKRNLAERQRLRRRRGTALAIGEASATSPHSLADTASGKTAPNLIRQVGLVQGAADYLRPSGKAAPAEDLVIDPLQGVGPHLSPEAKAAIEAEVAALSAAPLDIAEAVAEDQDEPLSDLGKSSGL